MFFLTGEYDHQIDAKNRIRIPAKLKGNEERLYFSKGSDGCIFVFYEEAIKAKMEKLEEIGLFDKNKQRGLRNFTNSIKPVDVDQQGRFVIPAELVNHAKIVKDVKICGSGSRIEVWAKEVYDEYMSGDDFDEDVSSLDMI